MSEAILDQGLDTESATATIMGIFQEISLMGANDSEHDQIMDIISRMKMGLVEPDEAIREAQMVRDSKTDYH